MTEHERRDQTPVNPDVLQERRVQVDRRTTYVTETTKNLEAAVKTLDEHIDRELKAVSLTALQVRLDMAASVDVLANTVSLRLRDIEAQGRARERIVLALMCVMLGLSVFAVAADLMGWGPWRAHGRALQLEILERVRAHDAVFER